MTKKKSVMRPEYEYTNTVGRLNLPAKAPMFPEPPPGEGWELWKQEAMPGATYRSSEALPGASADAVATLIFVWMWRRPTYLSVEVKVRQLFKNEDGVTVRVTKVTRSDVYYTEVDKGRKTIKYTNSSNSRRSFVNHWHPI